MVENGGFTPWKTEENGGLTNKEGDKYGAYDLNDGKWLFNWRFDMSENPNERSLTNESLIIWCEFMDSLWRKSVEKWNQPVDFRGA